MEAQVHYFRAYAVLMVSLAIHALAWLLILQFDRWVALLPESAQELIFEPPSKRPQNVDLILLESEPTKQVIANDKAPFLAQQTQRVAEQKQARFKGLTRNLEFPNRPRANRAGQDQQEAQTVTDQQGGMTMNATERLNRALSAGISTLSESLPENIKYGDFTALNTDQYLYFSFFNRIAPRIRFHWERGVDSSVEYLSLRNFQLSERRVFATEVEVKLNREGYLQGVTIYRSSGIAVLDQAVVRAFELATPFINPPQEMADAEGMIKLYYGFNVHFEPRYFAKPSR